MRGLGCSWSGLGIEIPAHKAEPASRVPGLGFHERPDDRQVVDLDSKITEFPHQGQPERPIPTADIEEAHAASRQRWQECGASRDEAGSDGTDARRHTGLESSDLRVGRGRPGDGIRLSGEERGRRG